MKKITDGTSYTYYVGEKTVNPMSYNTGKGTSDDNWPGTTASGIVTRMAFRVPGPDRENGCFECHDFGSAHRSGWYMCFCDGSVRRLNYDMDFLVHSALVTPDRGEIHSHFIDQELPGHLQKRFKRNGPRK